MEEKVKLKKKKNKLERKKPSIEINIKKVNPENKKKEEIIITELDFENIKKLIEK
jgi:hypothetical protein